MKCQMFVRMLLATFMVSLFLFAPDVKAGGSNPVIDSIEPAHPAPGQLVTIYGTNFLPLDPGENASQLQVWFVLSSGGVNCVSALSPGVEWDQNSIQLRIPANLPSGSNLSVVIIRGGNTSVATPFNLILGFNYFLPLLFK